MNDNPYYTAKTVYLRWSDILEDWYWCEVRQVSMEASHAFEVDLKRVLGDNKVKGFSHVAL